jgi:hypothetical protein
MAVKVQVVLDEVQREAFRSAAAREGLSLSAWLREAGARRLAEPKERKLISISALREFFSECDRREQGREPEWEEHLAVMEESRRSGRGGP